MKKIYILILIATAPLYSLKAQVSWLSKPLQSNSYIPPMDQSLVFKSLSQKQKLYDKNVQVIQNSIYEAVNAVEKINGINNKDYKFLKAVIDDSVKKLSSKNRDYSLSEVVTPILEHMKEIKVCSIVAQTRSLPDSIEFTEF